MSDILIRPPQLRTTADQIKQHAKAVQAAVDAVDASIKALGPAVFSGSRAEALRARYNRNRARFYNFKPVLEKFASELEQTAARFETADQNQAGETKRNPSYQLPIRDKGGQYYGTDLPKLNEYANPKLPHNQIVVSIYGINTTGNGGQWDSVLEKAGFSSDNIYCFSYHTDYKKLLEQTLQGSRPYDLSKTLHQTEDWSWDESTLSNWPNNQEQLAAYITLLQLQNPNADITLAGHSKGGIIAAGAVQYLGDNSQVKNVLTFGSPFDTEELETVAKVAVATVVGAATRNAEIGSATGEITVEGAIAEMGIDQAVKAPLRQNSGNIQFITSTGDDEWLAPPHSLKAEGVDQSFVVDTNGQVGKYGHNELDNTNDEASRVIRWTLENSIQRDDPIGPVLIDTPPASFVPPALA